MLPIPSSLLSAIIHATGRSLAERVAADAAKALLQSEEATQALRDEIEKAVDDLDLRDLAREEVQRVVEHDVDIDGAFEDIKDDIERNLRRAAEAFDLDDLVRDVVAESFSPADIVLSGRQAVVALVEQRGDSVVLAAGTALAEAVVAAAATDDQAPGPT
jgi:hypothetical protein